MYQTPDEALVKMWQTSFTASSCATRYNRASRRRARRRSTGPDIAGKRRTSVDPCFRFYFTRCSCWLPLRRRAHAHLRRGRHRTASAALRPGGGPAGLPGRWIVERDANNQVVVHTGVPRARRRLRRRHLRGQPVFESVRLILVRLQPPGAVEPRGSSRNNPGSHEPLRGAAEPGRPGTGRVSRRTRQSDPARTRGRYPSSTRTPGTRCASCRTTSRSASTSGAFRVFSHPATARLANLAAWVSGRPATHRSPSTDFRAQVRQDPGAMRILVVEDEKDLARALQRSLQEELFAVDLAFDGVEAPDVHALGSGLRRGRARPDGSEARRLAAVAGSALGGLAHARAGSYRPPRRFGSYRVKTRSTWAQMTICSQSPSPPRSSRPASRPRAPRRRPSLAGACGRRCHGGHGGRGASTAKAHSWT